MTVTPGVPQRWRPGPRFLFTAYAPTTLSSIGIGSVTPLIALTARDLGAGIGIASFTVALLGLGQLVGDLPAGALAARFGEKRALIGACLAEAAGLALAFLAPNVLVLGIAVFVCGLAGSMLALARQSWFTVMVPVAYRARALSTLGGTFRIGFVVGPLVGAALISVYSLTAAYAFAATMSLIAAAVTLLLPDLTETPPPAGTPSRIRTTTVLWEHRRVLMTVGIGVLMLMVARSSRQAIIPLWSESQGLSAATTSLIFGISAALDLVMFFPGGLVMDRFGRFWVAVPAITVLAIGLLLLPLTNSAVTITAVAVLMGMGNGISSGVVMTLGADAAPAVGRSQFLAGWRLFSDTGSSLGPLLITVITLVAPLAAASVCLGALCLLGTGWLARWLPRRRPSPDPRQA